MLAAVLGATAAGGPFPAPPPDVDRAAVARIEAPPLGLPPVAVPAENPPTAEKIALGRKLFFDRRLSRNGTMSCAVCHFTDSIESWAEMGYTRPLAAASRRLVMIDARGHGGSSRPYDPEAYAPEQRAGDVAAVLDALGLEHADILGYSMGGWSALAFACFFPDRLGRLIVGGAHPFGQSMAFCREAVASDISDWIAVLERFGRPLRESRKARIIASDLDALRAAVAKDRPDISAELAGLDRPFLFYAGSEDPLHEQVARCAQFLPRARFLEVPGCNHLTALLRADLVLPDLLAFLPGGSAQEP